MTKRPTAEEAAKRLLAEYTAEWNHPYSDEDVRVVAKHLKAYGDQRLEEAIELVELGAGAYHTVKLIRELKESK